MVGKKTYQILTALHLLSAPNGATKKEIAARLDLSSRSAYRIIEELQDYGFPVYDEKHSDEREKRWKVMPDNFYRINNLAIPDLKLSFAELISLYFLKSESRLFRGTDIEAYINSAFCKLSAHLPKGAEKKIGTLRKIFLPKQAPQKSYQGKDAIISTLSSAMMNNETCLADYHVFRDDEIRKITLDPLHFFESRGGLYALVRKTGTPDFRTLAVERFLAVTPTGQFFDYPGDFDAEAFINQPFDMISGSVARFRIWFSKEQARYIKERTWCRNQTITDLGDGSIVYEMTTSGWEDVKRWVLTYGRHARVMEPEAMKTELAHELKIMADAYAQKK